MKNILVCVRVLLLGLGVLRPRGSLIDNYQAHTMPTSRRPAYKIKGCLVHLEQT